MNPALQRFVSVALWIASWSQNKRFDDWIRRFEDLRSDINRRFDEVNRRFDEVRGDINRRFDEVNRRFEEVKVRLARIETKLDNHEERIVRVEERTSPVPAA